MRLYFSFPTQGALNLWLCPCTCDCAYASVAVSFPPAAVPVHLRLCLCTCSCARAPVTMPVHLRLCLCTCGVPVHLRLCPCTCGCARAPAAVLSRACFFLVCHLLSFHAFGHPVTSFVNFWIFMSSHWNRETPYFFLPVPSPLLGHAEHTVLPKSLLLFLTTISISVYRAMTWESPGMLWCLLISITSLSLTNVVNVCSSFPFIAKTSPLCEYIIIWLFIWLLIGIRLHFLAIINKAKSFKQGFV